VRVDDRGCWVLEDGIGARWSLTEESVFEWLQSYQALGNGGAIRGLVSYYTYGIFAVSEIGARFTIFQDLW
jgi:hypothetical protein